jgi:hypothetical protein
MLPSRRFFSGGTWLLKLTQVALARLGHGFGNSLRMPDDNPVARPYLHYFSALQQVICMAWPATIAYDFKQLSIFKRHTNAVSF